eukprot:5854861-Amphidinium_carterae.1
MRAGAYGFRVKAKDYIVLCTTRDSWEEVWLAHLGRCILGTMRAVEDTARSSAAAPILHQEPLCWRHYSGFANHVHIQQRNILHWMAIQIHVGEVEAGIHRVLLSPD